jgi:hypothetical protein
VKFKRARGMRDIPTIQGLRNRSVPNTREQTVSELARMEHEKARLERELSIWMRKREVTEDHLRQVQERITLLQQTLNPISPDNRPSAAGGGQDGDATEERAWQEIPLEY